MYRVFHMGLELGVLAYTEGDSEQDAEENVWIWLKGKWQKAGENYVARTLYNLYCPPNITY